MRSDTFGLRTIRGRMVGFGGAFLLLVLAANAALAQTETTLLTFNGTNGATPYLETLVQGRNGKLYGTTYGGGANNYGTVFSFNPANNGEVIMHSFAGTDGSYPSSGVTLDTDGNFYGTTLYGGSADLGVLYKISAAGTFTLLHQFLGGTTDGSYPYWPPIQASDGNLYGVASGGNFQAPILYKYTPAGVYSIIYTFDRSTSGWAVNGVMQGSDNLFYTLSGAGGANGCGSIAKITMAGVLKATHSFNCSNQGSGPTGLVEASDGTYYGTTYQGGTHDQGVLFDLTSSFGETILDDLSGDPEAPLMQASDGNLYFFTTNGSQLDSWNLTSGFSTVYIFTGSANLINGLAQDTSGVFYSLSEIDGADDDGYLFSIDTGLGPFVTFDRKAGAVGATTHILGQGLTGTTSVTFNGTAATYTVESDTYITVTVPAGATSGPVVVATPGGTLTSNPNFTVTE
jgi:uncharacterized repeat protein (TIGR03803 family)